MTGVLSPLASRSFIFALSTTSANSPSLRDRERTLEGAQEVPQSKFYSLSLDLCLQTGDVLFVHVEVLLKYLNECVDVDVEVCNELTILDPNIKDLCQASEDVRELLDNSGV